MKVCVLCRAPIAESQRSVILSDELGGGGPAHADEWEALLDRIRSFLKQEPLPTTGERII